MVFKVFSACRVASSFGLTFVLGIWTFALAQSPRSLSVSTVHSDTPLVDENSDTAGSPVSFAVVELGDDIRDLSGDFIEHAAIFKQQLEYVLRKPITRDQKQAVARINAIVSALLGVLSDCNEELADAFDAEDEL